MIFKTFITDANSLGVAIDRLGAVTKTNYALYGKALEGLSARQVALALSTKNLSNAELEEIIRVNHLIEKYGAEELIKVGLLSTNSALLASEKTLSAEKLVEAMVNAGANEERAEEFVKKHATTVINGEETTSEVVLTRALLDEAVANNILQKENMESILSKEGVILNDIKETASKKTLITALRKEASARLISISKYALLAASVYAVYKAHDYLVTTLNETEQKFNNQKSKLEEYQSELDSTSEKLSETKDKLNELNNLKINGEITTVQLEELSTLKQQTAEYQAQYDLILAKTEAQKIAAQASASELISLQKEYEKLQNSPWLKYSEKVFSVTQYNPYAAGGFTKGLEWLTSAFGKKENKVSKFFGGVNDWTSGRTLFEMATGIDTEGVKNYKTAEEYLEKYKKLQGELNDLYKKSESESLTVKESKRLLKLKEELGNVSPKLLDEYNNNLSVLELYKSDEHSKEIFEDAIKELENKNKAIMYALDSIDLENSSEDDIRDYVKYKLSESGITNEELIDSISKSADTYKVAAKMFKEGVSVEDIVSYLNPKDDLIDKLIPKKDELSAGIGFILQNAISQVDSNIVTDWINGLSDEDARIANSTKFDQELEKQKEKLNGATLSAKDYYEVLQRVKDSLNKEDVNVTSYVSFIDAFNSSDFAETKEKLLDLAKSGELTPETLSSTEDYKKLIDETELSAQYCCERIYDLVTAHGKLANITSGLSSLTNLYKQANENGYVDINDILKLDDTWKDLSSYEEFVDIIGSGTHSMSEIQDAFDKLTSEYLTHNNALNKLNESNKDLYINQLKNAGISNAQAIVEKKLANQYIADMSTYEGLTQANKDLYVEKLKNKDIANAEQIVQKVLDAEYITQTDALNGLTEANKAEYEAKLKAEGVTNANTIITNKLRAEKEAEETVTEKLNMTMNEFNSKSYEVQNSLLDEANASTLCRNEIVELQLAEIKYNNQGLDVTGKINQLKDLAIAYGIANTKAQEMAEREQQMRDYESRTGANTGFKYTEADWKHAEEDLRKQIDASFANLGDNSYTIDIKYDGGTDYQKELADKQEKNAEKSEQIFDWIERKVNNLTKSLNDLKDASDDTYSSWTNRNTALTKAIDTTRQAIELQQQAYSRYMQQAESVGLPDIYKNLIKNGALDISIITDDDLKDKISDYQEWYDKAQDCLDVQKDLMDSLNELNSKKFDNIQSIFEFDKSNIEHSLTMLNNQIDKLEMKGLFANESYYNQMLQYTQKEINSLTNERKQLANVMNSSALSQDSEAWREMYSTLTQIDEEILELNNDIVEFNNSIRDLNWEVFEYLEESINRITDETEYLTDLLSNEDLYDENGNLTKYANATIGLYATAYDTYKQQAKDYYEEVQDLQRQLVNGAGKDVLEQYYKMVDAHQEAVLAAEDEKQAILDLIEDGYQKQIDYLNEIINKKKDSLNAEKD